MSAATHHHREAQESARAPRPAIAEIVWAMDVFAELVDPAGPLCALRLNPGAFAQCVKNLSPAVHEQVIERAFDEHIEALVPPAVLHRIRTALSQFIGLTYIDESHRTAARTALALLPESALRQGAQGRDAPSLYPIFLAQFRELAGPQQDG